VAFKRFSYLTSNLRSYAQFYNAFCNWEFQRHCMVYAVTRNLLKRFLRLLTAGYFCSAYCLTHRITAHLYSGVTFFDDSLYNLQRGVAIQWRSEYILGVFYFEYLSEIKAKVECLWGADLYLIKNVRIYLVAIFIK